MAHCGDYLYVADVCRVHVINLKTGVQYAIPLATEDSYANHIVVIGDMLLLSSTDSGHILALDLRPDGSPSVSGFQILTTVPGANGMLYHNGALYIASYNPDSEITEQNIIYVIDDFTHPTARTFISRQGQYDGLAEKDGWLYFSDWNGGIIGKISLSKPDKTEIIKLNLDKPLAGPAQIAFFDNYLCIPDLPNSRIVMLQE